MKLYPLPRSVVPRHAVDSMSLVSGYIKFLRSSAISSSRMHHIQTTYDFFVVYICPPYNAHLGKSSFFVQSSSVNMRWTVPASGNDPGHRASCLSTSRHSLLDHRPFSASSQSFCHYWAILSLRASLAACRLSGAFAIAQRSSVSIFIGTIDAMSVPAS